MANVDMAKNGLITLTNDKAQINQRVKGKPCILFRRSADEKKKDKQKWTIII